MGAITIQPTDVQIKRLHERIFTDPLIRYLNKQIEFHYMISPMQVIISGSGEVSIVRSCDINPSLELCQLKAWREEAIESLKNNILLL